jgi:hypothetical protein
MAQVVEANAAQLGVPAIESASRAPQSIYKAITEPGNTKGAFRDTLTAVCLPGGPRRRSVGQRDISPTSSTRRL